ncbi:MAG: hypothetical protein K8R49_06855, partial [Candidatus Cloacimonetes bacterium]|nr:hypothetical protein [Candidatus Cloacimonadota bacterium]
DLIRSDPAIAGECESRIGRSSFSTHQASPDESSLMTEAPSIRGFFLFLLYFYGLEKIKNYRKMSP